MTPITTLFNAADLEKSIEIMKNIEDKQKFDDMYAICFGDALDITPQISFNSLFDKICPLAQSRLFIIALDSCPKRLKFAKKRCCAPGLTLSLKEMVSKCFKANHDLIDTHILAKTIRLLESDLACLRSNPST